MTALPDFNKLLLLCTDLRKKVKKKGKNYYNLRVVE